MTSKLIKSNHRFGVVTLWIMCIFFCTSLWTLGLLAYQCYVGSAFTVHCGLFSPIVGLDIQQKFNVYYSGDRRFGTDNPYNISYDRTGQRPQHSALKPQSTCQAAAQREDATSAPDQGTTLQLCY